MTGRQEARYKVISVLMVAGFVFSFFAGMTPVNAAQTPAASVAGTGDLTVGVGEEFVINNYTHYMDGNVTVNGGTLKIINGSLAFLQDINHTYHMDVINGGKVIMENGTITDHLDQIHTYPYVRMSVANSEVIMSNKSSLVFPGWLNVTGSYFNMTDSTITSIDDANVSAYVGDPTNTAEGDNANDCPIIEFRDSEVYLYDSNISNLFEYKKGDGRFYTDNFNLTLSGTTNLTAVDTYIAVDLSNINASFQSDNREHKKNSLVLEDTANAYLYGLSIDDSETPAPPDRDTAFALNGTGAVYLFRWADYTVVDNNSLPVPGAGLASLEISNGSDPVVYPSSHGNLTIPPAEVLTYLGKNATNYNITDERGEATIPYLTDIVLTGSKPNSDFIGNYMTYANYTDSSFHSADFNFSFEPYPSFISAKFVGIKMTDLTLPLPELFVSSLSITPSPVFEGDNATLTAVVNNTGGSNAVDVNVSFYDGDKYINSTIIPLITVGSSANASIIWNSTWTTAGPHVINVTVDPVVPGHPRGHIVEENEDNNTYLQQVTVETRLPDLTLTQIDITTTPASPYAGNDFTVSAVIHNVGDVDANNVLIAFYNGTPDSNGDLVEDLNADIIGTTTVNVAAGSHTVANITTSFDVNGTYDIYVWADPYNSTQEYSYTNNTAYTPITILPKPNLEIAESDISFSNASPYVGQSVTINATIHNTGALDVSDDFDVYFFLDKNNSDSIVGIFSYSVVSGGNLVAGGSTIATISWVANLSGAHTIYVDVNYNKTVDESTYLDNSASSSLIVQKPNLEISDSDISISDQYPDVGQSVTITATVHNTEGVDISDNFDVYFFLDDNNSGSVIGISHHSGNVAAGASTIVTISWTANPSGEHKILVSVNYNRTVDESTYSDNSAQSSLIVMRAGDTDLIVNDTHYSHLTIDFDYSLSGYVLVEEHGVLTINNSAFSVIQDSSEQYSFIIRDNGTVYLNTAFLYSNHPITIFLYDNAKLVTNSSFLDSSITANDSSSMQIKNSMIFESATAHDSSHLKLENSWAKGISFPDADSTAVLEAYNTTFSQPFDTVKGNTHLYLTNVGVDSISLSDSSVARIYRWLKVSTLDGNGYALTNVTVESYFPLNGTHWKSAVSGQNGALISILTDTLYGDENTPHEIIGGYMLNGSYVFRGTTYFSEDCHISPKNYPDMANLHESQYQSVVMKFDSLKPDLDPPVYVSNPNPVLGIDSIYINATVWNNGTAAAYDVDVGFYDNLISIGDVYIDELGVGESYNCSIVWTATYPVGIHNISVVADPNHQISELNESNNVGWTTVNVTGWPDLTLSSGDITFITQGPAMRGGEISIRATIHNHGDSASETTEVAFYDGNPEAGGTQFDIVNIGSISVGGTETAVTTWQPDSAGNHSIYVVVDPEHNIDETNENNNVAHNRTKILNYPDLYITSMTFQDEDVYEGDNVTVSVIVGNGGQSPAANVVVELFDITGGAHEVVASDSIPSIAPDNFATVTFHWTAPLSAGMVTENHTFSAVVDGYNQIPETNEQNNALNATITVRDARPDISFAGDVMLNYTSENLTGGDEVNISFTLINSGAANASVDVLINASLSNGTEYTIATISGLNVSADNQTDGYYLWTVGLPAEVYGIRVIADPNNAINETNEDNNVADNATLTIVPPVPAFGAYPNTPHIQNALAEYNAGNVVTVAGTIINTLNQAPLSGVSVTASLLDSDGLAVTDASGNPVTATSVTDANGNYIINILLPGTMKTGDYRISVSATGIAQAQTTPGGLHVQGASAGLSWLYILLAIVILAGIFIPMIYLKFFGKLGEMVECGACGALIPAGSTKCPKCGVEFETETAKCSVCGAWVPIDASICPECGAVFAPVTEEEEYQQRMHEEYEEEVLNPLKEAAKEEMGEEYEDEKFMEWAAAQEGFIAFDDWLEKREEEREKMVECPTCGALNPPDALVCQACGSELPAREEKPKPKKIKKKVKKEKPPEEETPLTEEKEEPGVALGLDDVLGTTPEKREEKTPAPRKVMKPAPSMTEKQIPPQQPPTEGAKPQDTTAQPTAQPRVRKVVKKPVQKRVVKRPIRTDEKKE